MSDASFVRAAEILDELATLLSRCNDEGTWDGHDQMMARQLALLLYLTAKPKTHEKIDDFGTQFRTLLDHDFQMLLARVAAKQGLG